MKMIITVVGITGLLFCMFLFNRFKKTSSYTSSFSLLSIISTLIATEFGNNLFLGSIVGVYGIFYIIGTSLGILLLGLGLATKIKAINAATTGQVFQLKYHSIPLKKIASFLYVLTCFSLLVGVIGASQSILHHIGLDTPLLFFGFWALIIVYTLLGGLRALGITDLFQMMYLLIIFGSIFVYCLFKEPPSFSILSTMLPVKTAITSWPFDIYTFISSLTMPALYCITQQDSSGPLFSIHSKRATLIACICVSCFMILFSLFTLYFDAQAKLLDLSIAQGESSLIPVLRALTNEFTVSLVLCVIILAFISTAHSLLETIANSVLEDFELKGKIVQSHVITLVVGISCLASTYYSSGNLISLLALSYELYDNCLLVPLLAGFFKDNVKKGAAIGSIIGGIIGFFLFRLVAFAIPREIMGILFSIFGYWLGSYLIDIFSIKKPRTCSV
jgi:SSS family solute:Na+ symporter